MTNPGENGPLYILLLRAWSDLTGQSEFALRFFSVLPSVLAVPLLFLLGRRLLGARAGVIAALLLTFSTYALWYAQMVRMYSLVLLLAVLSSYLLLRALERPQVRWWAAYTAATTVAMYTHVFGALLIPWHGAFVIAVLAIGALRRAAKLAAGVIATIHWPRGQARVDARGGAFPEALEGRGDTTRGWQAPAGYVRGSPPLPARSNLSHAAAGHFAHNTDLQPEIASGSRPRNDKADGLSVPGDSTARGRRILLLWLASLAALTLPYLPLAVARLDALRSPETLTRQFTGPRSLAGMVATLAREYGTKFDLISLDLLATCFLALLLLAVPALMLSRRWRAALFLALGLAAPVGLTWLMVRLGAPLFSSRYLLLTMPVFLLTWAAAIAWVGRRAPWVAALLVLAFIGVNAARWWETAVNGAHFREDWRAATTYLEQREHPGEPVLVLHDPAWRAVNYYRRNPIVLVSLEGGPDRPVDLAKAPPLPAGSRVWLLWAWFEGGDVEPVERWLDAHGAALFSKAFLPGVTVSEYRVDSK